MLSLIFSGGLNIGLLTALIAVLLDDQKFAIAGTPPLVEQKEEITNERLAAHYERSSFRELVALLQNKELIEDGYRKCDLALGALVSFHHFNLEKALGGLPLQRRVVKNSNLELFPGLSDEQFLAILRFAHQERWPFTPRGLFMLLKGDPREEGLVQAFSLTPQFMSVQKLFPKASVETLIRFVCGGEWAFLEQFTKEQATALVLSDERRKEFLGGYPPCELLLEMDFSYALKKLDDESLVSLLDHSAQSALLHSFCTALLESPRSDAVREKSAEKLYAMAQEQMPRPFDYLAALARFVSAPQKKSQEIKVEKGEASPAILIHTIKEGETLWKIARKYQVKVEELISLNTLQGSTLRVGTAIKVPDRSPRDERGGSAASAAR